MYDTILYPTDGSAGAEAALAHARDHAQQYGAEVHVLFVADSSLERSEMVGEERAGTASGMRGEERDHEPSGLIAEDTDPLDTVEAEGKAVVERVGAAFGDDVSVTTAVRRAAPYSGIIEYAGGIEADLIVMGTHGRRGIDRYLLGSVAEKVVRTSEVPVLTVRLDEE
jgi:nucleotide-binding universal stress UspA family protein